MDELEVEPATNNGAWGLGQKLKMGNKYVVNL